jgi:CO/xanthine dehydrogenase Mo-binding subunit
VRRAARVGSADLRADLAGFGAREQRREIVGESREGARARGIGRAIGQQPLEGDLGGTRRRREDRRADGRRTVEHDAAHVRAVLAYVMLRDARAVRAAPEIDLTEVERYP